MGIILVINFLSWLPQMEQVSKLRVHILLNKMVLLKINIGILLKLLDLSYSLFMFLVSTGVKLFLLL